MPTEHIVHQDHPHLHTPNCGHTAIQHGDHVDFLHEGHLHFPHDGHVDDHTLDVSGSNPADCTNGHNCQGHDAEHVHGANCGHAAVPHGDHVDYLVNGHLHHPHAGHCDNHGNVTLA